MSRGLLLFFKAYTFIQSSDVFFERRGFIFIEYHFISAKMMYQRSVFTQGIIFVGHLFDPLIDSIRYKIVIFLFLMKINHIGT